MCRHPSLAASRAAAARALLSATKQRAGPHTPSRCAASIQIARSRPHPVSVYQKKRAAGPNALPTGEQNAPPVWENSAAAAAAGGLADARGACMQQQPPACAQQALKQWRCNGRSCCCAQGHLIPPSRRAPPAAGAQAKLARWRAAYSDEIQCSIAVNTSIKSLLSMGERADRCV